MDFSLFSAPPPSDACGFESPPLVTLTLHLKAKFQCFNKSNKKDSTPIRGPCLIQLNNLMQIFNHYILGGFAVYNNEEKYFLFFFFIKRKCMKSNLTCFLGAKYGDADCKSLTQSLF